MTPPPVVESLDRRHRCCYLWPPPGYQRPARPPPRWCSTEITRLYHLPALQWRPPACFRGRLQPMPPLHRQPPSMTCSATCRWKCELRAWCQSNGGRSGHSCEVIRCLLFHLCEAAQSTTFLRTLDVSVVVVVVIVVAMLRRPSLG